MRRLFPLLSSSQFSFSPCRIRRVIVSIGRKSARTQDNIARILTRYARPSPDGVCTPSQTARALRRNTRIMRKNADIL